MADRLTWTDIFAVGHSALDAEHRSLVDIINAIGDPGRVAHEVRSLFGQLRTAATGHFQHETAILRRVVAGIESGEIGPTVLRVMSHKVLLQHIDSHDWNLRELDSLASDGHPRGVDLEHWFISHAVKHDAHLKSLFQAIQSDCPKLMAALV